MPQYYVIQPDGQKLGPYAVDELKRMGAAGAITPQTMIQDADTGESVPAVALPHILPDPPATRGKLPAWAVKRITLVSRLAWTGIVFLICWFADVRNFLFTSRPAAGWPAVLVAFVQAHPIALLLPGLIFLFAVWATLLGVRNQLRAERMAAPVEQP